MVCHNCNSTVNSDAVFCRNCGSKLVASESESVVNAPIVDNGENNDLNISQNQQEQNSNIDLSNQKINISYDDLVDAYIGKNASKLRNGFSFCTLFFGVLYILYRKMCLLGFIWLLINVFLSTFLPKLVWVALIINVFVAFCFKTIYISHVSEKVNKLKIQYPKLSNKDLIFVCNKKGGTTIVPIILFIIIYLLIAFSSTLITLGIINESRDNLNKTTAQYIVNAVESSYNISLTENLNLRKNPSIDQIKTNFKMNGATWNNDNTITSTTGEIACKVLVNVEKQMTVECDVKGEKIVSDLMQLSE